MSGAGQWVAQGLTLILVGLAAWTDLRRGLIPNRLTVPALAAGLVIGALRGGGPGLLAAACGALVAALVPLVLYRFGALGGGDVKLLAALGALLGSGSALEAETLAFGVGAVWGLGRWLFAGRLRGGLKAVGGLVLPVVGRRLLADPEVVAARRTTIRFGPAVAVGALAVIAWGVVR